MKSEEEENLPNDLKEQEKKENEKDNKDEKEKKIENDEIKDKEQDKGKEKEKEIEKDKVEEKEKDKEKEIEKEKEKEKVEDKDRDKEKEKEKEIDKDKEKDKNIDKEKDKIIDIEKEKEKNNEKEKDNEKEKKKEIGKDSYFFIIEKTPEWDKVVPHIIEAIDEKKNDNSVYSEYPYFRIQNAVQYLPKIDKPSDILSTEQLRELHSRLPAYHQYTNLYKIFSISVDGSSLKTLYNKCEGITNSVLIIKDDDGNIFGAYASEEYAPSSKFFGTGECFLFTFYKLNKIHVYCSTGINDSYMYCDNEQISFGCSDDYFSLCLRNNLLDGYSRHTKTYNNEPLNNKDKFVIYKLEIFGFKKHQ